VLEGPWVENHHSRYPHDVQANCHASPWNGMTIPRGRPSMWACIVVWVLWLEMPLRAARTVAAPHFTHRPFRMRET
jgi:hypothetical protein